MKRKHKKIFCWICEWN